MNFSSWSIRNPVPAILLFILLTVLGLVCFQKLHIQDFPDMDVPVININARLESAAPQQLETEVARKIEDRLASLNRLDHITTTITDSSVQIMVSFDIEKDSEEALSEVRNAVDSARADLPASMNPPTVSKLTSANMALLTYTAQTQRLDEQDLSWFIDNEVSKALLAVKGVAKVDRIGGVDREVHVELDPTLMAGLGVTPADVSARLRAMQQDASGGTGDVGGQRQASRTLGTVSSPAEVGALTVPLADGRYIRLDQVAHISDNHAERNTLAFLDGKPVIGFQVTRSRGYSDVTVANGVREVMTQLRKTHPQMTLTEASNTITPIEENYTDSMHLMYEGALLAIIVVWWFLRDWRATLVAATALPLSIIPTFGFMFLADYSLNVVTLLSLSLVVGILVDDAIVEIENIERHLKMGKTPFQAAMEAADEIGMAVIATTFTLVAVFLPTAFMGGIPGKFFRQFGLTASIAVLASLLVARLLTPMMAAYLMKPRHTSHSTDAADGPMMTRYLNWVRAALGNRKRTVLATAAFFVVAIGAAPFIGTSFMPAKDRSQTTITLKLPPGSTLQDMAAITQRADALLRTLPEVKSVFTAVGKAAAGDGPDASSSADLASATLTIDLVERGDRKLKQSAVETKMRELLRTLPGVRASIVGDDSAVLVITLASDDPLALGTVAQQAEEQLRTLKGIGSVTSSAALQQPEIQITPDHARAAALGVTSEALADAVRLGTYGDYSTALPKLNLPQRQIPIRVRMAESARDNLDAVAALRVNGKQGAVSLGSVASVTMGSGPAQIDRIDRSRNVKLTLELNGRFMGEVQKEALSLPALRNLPAGVHLVEEGEVQRMSDLFASFGIAMAVGVFCIYAVLVLLFHDFLQPATILCALPLALAGALFTLWITGQAFSMPVMIGLLMLMGIVTKNSILLVEYAIVARRAEGISRLDAVMDACHKRARPIVMTTIAMGAGMLPNALGIGGEPSFRQPMAIVVIGGLITSTFLSLLVIPVVFTYVDDMLQWGRRMVLTLLHRQSGVQQV